MVASTDKVQVPKLRFSQFIDAWVMKPLREFMTFKNGINADKEQYGQGYKFINVLDIIADEPITHNNIRGCVDVSSETFEKSKVTYGDILFQRSSETREEAGQANVYLDQEKPATFGGFVIRGKSKGNYHPVFMNYLLKTDLVRSEITARSGGSTRYNVGQATLESTPVTITESEKEQQKIADFLTAVDTKIQQLKRKHDLMQQYKKGVMQQLFSQQVRFKDDDGRDYPDWQEKRLGELFHISAGGDVGKLNFSKTKTEEHQIPVYANALQAKGLHGYTDKPIVTKDAVTVTGRGDVGHAEARLFPFVAVVRLLVLLPKEKISVTFFSNLINSLNIFVESTGVPQLTAPQLSTYKVHYPPFKEQEKIAGFLVAIDSKIQQIGAQIEKAETFKQGLLQQMFV